MVIRIFTTQAILGSVEVWQSLRRGLLQSNDASSGMQWGGIACLSLHSHDEDSRRAVAHDNVIKILWEQMDVVHCQLSSAGLWRPESLDAFAAGPIPDPDSCIAGSCNHLYKNQLNSLQGNSFIRGMRSGTSLPNLKQFQKPPRPKPPQSVIRGICKGQFA